jgi:hypothetical protein
MNSQVHTNTWWIVLNLSDQMKTPLFHSPSLKPVSTNRWRKGLSLTSCLIKIIGCCCWQYNWNSGLQWNKAIKVVGRNYQVTYHILDSGGTWVTPCQVKKFIMQPESFCQEYWGSTHKLSLDLRLVKELSLRKVHRVFSFLDLYRNQHSSACSKYNVCAGKTPRPWCELKRGELDIVIVWTHADFRFSLLDLVIVNSLHCDGGKCSIAVYFSSIAIAITTSRNYVRESRRICCLCVMQCLSIQSYGSLRMEQPWMGFWQLDSVRPNKRRMREVVEATKWLHQIVLCSRSFLVAFVVSEFVSTALVTT